MSLGLAMVTDTYKSFHTCSGLRGRSSEAARTLSHLPAHTMLVREAVQCVYYKGGWRGKGGVCGGPTGIFWSCLGPLCLPLPRFSLFCIPLCHWRCWFCVPRPRLRDCFLYTRSAFTPSPPLTDKKVMNRGFLKHRILA